MRWLIANNFVVSEFSLSHKTASCVSPILFLLNKKFSRPSIDKTGHKKTSLAQQSKTNISSSLIEFKLLLAALRSPLATRHSPLAKTTGRGFLDPREKHLFVCLLGSRGSFVELCSRSPAIYSLQSTVYSLLARLGPPRPLVELAKTRQDSLESSGRLQRLESLKGRQIL